MKNFQIKILVTLMFLYGPQKLCGQATSGNASNAYTIFDYNGWVNGTNQPLDTKNEDAFPLYFYTNAGSATYNNMRMSILGAYNSTGGLVGIGDMGTRAAPFTPNYLLSSYRTGNTNVFHQWINDNTGNGATDGFRIGLNYKSNVNTWIPLANFSAPELRNYQNSPIYFYTNNGERMNINMRTINSIQRSGVTISETAANPITFPRSILHLGSNYFTAGIAGWRTWMDVGTFTEIGSDLAFYGIMPTEGDTINPPGDRNDAVIAWGDNENPADDGADNLRFIFSAPMTQTANDWQTQYSALETGRFEPHGRLGVGNFTANAWGGGSGIQPLRRLEVYDEHLNATLVAAPQLRLTFNPHANVTLGEHTDFQAMTNGDLFIHPSTDATGVQRDRMVGVNVSSPASVMHLYGINVPTGEMFRTDGVNSEPQYWRMERDGTHYGWLWNNATTTDANDFCIGAPTANVKIYTRSGAYSGTTTPMAERLIVTDGTGSLNGFVGIGNNFLSPKSRLHLNQGSTDDCWFQMTNTTTANTNNGLDGLRIGVLNSSMNVEIKQQEIADMLFYTTGTSGVTAERMRILSEGNVGIGTAAPANKLEVDATGTYNYLLPLSGVRLTDMRSGSTTSGPSGGKVLSVNTTGDIILVDDAGAGSLSVCASPGLAINYLTKNSATNEICRSYVYEESSSPYKVDITNGAGPASNTQLTAGGTAANSIYRGIYGYSVGNNSVSTITGMLGTAKHGGLTTIGIETYAESELGTVYGAYVHGKSITASATDVYGLYTRADKNATSGTAGSCTGVISSTWCENAGELQKAFDGGVFSTGDNSTVYAADLNVESYGDGSTTYGISNFINANAANNETIYGEKTDILSYSSSNPSNAETVYGNYINTNASSDAVINCGVEAIAIDGANVFGGRFTASSGSNLNYGVYASGGTNCTGTTTTSGCPNAAGYFSGDVNVTHALYQGSDLILKDNVLPLVGASAIINQLNPKTYIFKTQMYPSMNLGDGNHFGLIAEELELVLPELVRGFKEPEVKDTLGVVVNAQVDYKAINYIALVPILIASNKEMQLRIDSLVNVIAAQPIKQSNPNLPNQENKITIELSNQNSIILNQNDPNPFAESTTISYNIPVSVKTAQLLFYDNTGTVLKTLDILERGAGSVLVYASNLSKGVYNYTLLIEGKVFETKKMVKQ